MTENKRNKQQKLGFFMDYGLFILTLFCIVGCGATSWHLGRRVGIEDAVQHMMDNGMLPDVEE